MVNPCSDRLNEELLTCPINKTVYKDPVILVGDGFTYEREAIKQWLNIKNKSPVTNKYLKSTKLVQNKAIRAILHALNYDLSNADLEEMVLLDDLMPYEVILFGVVFINNLVIVNSMFLYTIVSFYVVISLVLIVNYSEAVFVMKQGNDRVNVTKWSFQKNRVLNSGLFLLVVMLFSHVLINKRVNHMIVCLDLCFMIYYLVNRR